MKNLMVVVVSAVALASFGYTVDPGSTLQVNDSNVGLFASGIEFADATGTVEFDTSAAPTMAITGQGTCVKTSSAAWTMSTDRTAFNGKWILRSGIVTAASSSKSVFNKGAAGDANTITVEDGATLYIAAVPKLNGTGQLGSSDIHIAGTGYNGQGALKTDLSSPNYSTVCYFFTKIILDDDASINPTAGCGYCVTIETQGHDLTFSGSGSWYLTSAKVTGGGNIHYPVSSTTVVKASQIGTEDQPGSISLANGVNFSVFGEGASIGAKIYAALNPVGDSGFGHSHRYDSLMRFTPKADCCATCYGPITIPEGKTFVTYAGSYACRNVLDGELKGSGTIAGYDGKQRGRVELNSPNNPDFTGSIHFYGKNESMALGGYKMIDDWTKLTGEYGGALALDMDDEGKRWTNAQVAEMANKATLKDDTILGLDPKYCTDHKVSFDGSAFFKALTTTTLIGLGNASVTWDSEATISFNSAVSRDIVLGSLGGTAVVTGSVPITVERLFVGVPRAARDQQKTPVGNQEAIAKLVLSGVDVTLPEGARARVGGFYSPIIGTGAENQWEVGRFGELVVTNATLTGFDHPTFPMSMSDALWLGWNGDGILNIRKGGVVTTRLNGAEEQGGYGNSYLNNARAAVYVDGGTFNLRGDIDTSSNANWNRTHLNYSSYGYLGAFNGGALKATGNWAAQFSSNSALEFDHATWTHDAASTAAKFDFTYSGNADSLVQCYLKDSQADFGTMTVYATSGNLNLTLDGAGTVFKATALSMQGSRDIAQAVTLNLNNGAEINFEGFGYAHDKLTQPHTCLVNFNGGRLVSTRKDWAILTTGEGLTAHDREIVLYEGGGEVCVSNNTTLGATVLAPEENGNSQGVASIPLAAAGTGYIGSPVIKIEGDGRGATAFARFDPETRTIKEIKVTSPGFGYTWAKAHFVENNRYTNAVVVCTLAANALTGGFTKSGPGTLTLDKTNSYHGVTKILEGTLTQGCDYAIPSNAIVRVDGGTLNLNEKEHYFKSFGGTSGAVKSPKGGTVRTEGLELGTTSALSFDRYYTVTVCGLWSVDVADLLAGETAQYESGIIFEEGSTLALGNTELLEDEAVQKNAPYTILSTVGTMKPDRTQGIVGEPTLVTELPKGWSVKKRGNKLVLRYERGTLLILR